MKRSALLLLLIFFYSFAGFAQSAGGYNPASSGDSSCVVESTRAAILSLSGNYDLGCHYVITDPPATGNLTATRIVLHATSTSSMSMDVEVSTTHDNESWNGLYDLAANRIIYVEDNLSNKVGGNTIIASFPFGVSAVSENTLDNPQSFTYVGGTFRYNDVDDRAVVVMNGGTLSHSTIGEGASVTINSGSNYENTFGNSTIYNQVGTGYIRYSTIEGTTSWTNGNTNLSNVHSVVSTVNTTGSIGTISNSTFNRLIATAAQNIPVFTITDCSFNSYTTISASNSGRLYLYRSNFSDGARIILSANIGAELRASYVNVSSFGYLQTTQGSLICNYTNVSSHSYCYSQSVYENRIDRCEASGYSRIRFLDSARDCRTYYSIVSGGAFLEHRGTSTGSYIYYAEASSSGQIYTDNSVDSRMYYCSAIGRGRVYSQNNSILHYMYYCSADANGLVFALNNSGPIRMYSIKASSNAIARMQNTTVDARWYYSTFTSYFYAYFTFTTTGTRSGFFGQGRRSYTRTDPTKTSITLNQWVTNIL